MTSIQYLNDKIKSIILLEKNHYFQLVVIIAVAIGSFFLGRISINNNNHQKVDITTQSHNNTSKNYNYYQKANISENNSLLTGTGDGMYVASKNGKLYYRVGCGASSRIKPENKIFFKTIDEANQAGLNGSPSCTP